MNPQKAKAWLQGPRGGWFYTNARGEKKYGKEALEAARGERMPPPARTGGDPLLLMKQAKAIKTQELVSKAMQQGGLTYDAVNDRYPDKGYVVSTHPELEVQVKELTEEHLAKYIEDNKDFLNSTEGAHVGIWYDSKKEKWFLDVSHVTTDPKEARQGALTHGQYGYFDLAGGKEVRMDDDPEWLAKWPGRRRLE